MDKNLDTNPFDDLLRSKYENEQTTPPKVLWENIRSSLGEGNSHVSVWTKAYLVWSSPIIIVITVLVIAFFTILFLTKKPSYNSNEKTAEIKIQKTTEKKKELAKNTVAWNHNRKRKVTLKTHSKAELNTLVIPVQKQPANSSVQVLSKSSESGIIQSQHKQTVKNRIVHPQLKPLNAKSLPQYQLLQPENGQFELPTNALPLEHSPVLNNDINNKKKGLKTKNLSTNNHRVCIKVFFNPEFSFRYLSNNLTYAYADYNKAYFDKRDLYGLTYSYGFNVAYRFSPHFSIKTGVVMAPYSIRFSTERFSAINNGESLIYTSSGIAKVVIHSSDTILSSTLLKSSINLYYLQLPVGVQYKISNYFSIDASLFFELLTSHNLNWKAENYQGEIDISTENIKDINKFTMGMTLEVEYEKSIYKNLYFSISPNFSMHILSINNKNTVKSYPYSLGLQIGIKYYIF